MIYLHLEKTIMYLLLQFISNILQYQTESVFIWTFFSFSGKTHFLCATIQHLKKTFKGMAYSVQSA